MLSTSPVFKQFFHAQVDIVLNLLLKFELVFLKIVFIQKSAYSTAGNKGRKNEFQVNYQQKSEILEFSTVRLVRSQVLDFKCHHACAKQTLL